MKKISIYTLVLLLSMVALVWAKPSITITNPNPTYPNSDPPPWFAGDTHQIRWITDRTLSNVSMNIYLMSGSGKRVIQTIARNIFERPSHPGYTWHIPASLNTGKYKIRISAASNRVHGDSVPFRILNIPINERITVTYPDVSVPRWYRESRYLIRWNPCEGLRCATVNIYLITEAGSIAHTVATNVSTQRKEWLGIPIPRAVPYGRYKIKVATTDNTGYGTSPAFEVTDAPEIHVFSPSPGSTFYPGDTILIEWNSTPVVTGTIAIWARLRTPQNREVTIHLYRGPNTHTFDWYLDPRKVVEGHGYIVVSSDEFKVHDIVRNITIKRLRIKSPVDLKKFPLKRR